VTDFIDRARLLFLLHEDQALLDRMCDAELLPRGTDRFTLAQAETARVVGTLVHELQVNWSGVEVVLHLRSELVTTRRQATELLRLLRARRG
jgi:hypothetical protein